MSTLQHPPANTAPPLGAADPELGNAATSATQTSTGGRDFDANMPAGFGDLSPAKRRRPWRLYLVIVLVVAAVALLAMFKVATTNTPYSPYNPNPDGAMAIANLLDDQGVDVRTVSTLNALGNSVTENDVIVVAGTTYLTDEQWFQLSSLGNDVVLLATYFSDEELFGTAVTYLPQTVLTADCDDRDAQGAGRIAGVEMFFEGDGCFPSGSASFMQVRHDVGYPGVTVWQLSDANFLTNANLAKEGNAALALRLLGRSDSLLWYLPTSGDNSTLYSQYSDPSSPPWLQWSYYYLAVIALAAAWWRGRRLGPVVVEKLPVVVPATETVRGRGMLYAKAKDRAHAAAKLRAGAQRRYRKALGLGRAAPAEAFISSLQADTGMTREYLTYLFYGPVPTTDAELVQLAEALRQVRKHHD